MNRLTLIFFGVCLTIGVWFGLQKREVIEWPEEAGVIYPSARSLNLNNIELTTGAALDRTFFEDKWTIVFLGYTYCPDICPTTLNDLGKFEKQISDKDYASMLQVLFVTADPKRDSLQRLNEYTGYFSKKFISATGHAEDLKNFSQSMNLMFIENNSSNDEHYLVDHSSAMALINPNGQFQATFTAPHKIENLEMAFDFLYANSRKL